MNELAKTLNLPQSILRTLSEFLPPDEQASVIARMRAPDDLMQAEKLSAIKASRVSFSDRLIQKMIDERWSIRRESFSCDQDGEGFGVYRIDAGGHKLTYLAHCYKWDGVEKVGRRSDGAARDLFGAIFLGHPDQARLQEEMATFNLRDQDAMRTRSDVTGWNPASRSASQFDHVVDSLIAGKQPDPKIIGSGTGYILRNGGYLGSGRQGSVSIEGLPADHPFRHPFFGDLFGLYMVRQISIDLVNGVAAAKNPNAAQLSPEMARYIGVGNSSGQGMCVAMQRWPEWVSSWLVVREISLAYATTRLITNTDARQMQTLLRRASVYLAAVKLQCEDYVVRPSIIAENLVKIAVDGSQFVKWSDVSDRVEREFDLETTGYFQTLNIELFREFADAVAPYLKEGFKPRRDIKPGKTVADVQALLLKNYKWLLRNDQRLSKARQHFWYHSVDNGEQRRGERVIDPHEEFESFIDHIGLIQRVACVLSSYDAETSIAEVVADCPDLYYGVARVQYLADLPYADFRVNLLDRDFLPAHLIRFYLATLGIEGSNPLSIRYVRGVFFQGAPLPDEIERGANPSWRFPKPPQEALLEEVQA